MINSQIYITNVNDPNTEIASKFNPIFNKREKKYQKNDVNAKMSPAYNVCGK